jgi:hypothetical protein
VQTLKLKPVEKPVNVNKHSIVYFNARSLLQANKLDVLYDQLGDQWRDSFVAISSTGLNPDTHEEITARVNGTHTLYVQNQIDVRYDARQMGGCALFVPIKYTVQPYSTENIQLENDDNEEHYPAGNCEAPQHIQDNVFSWYSQKK